ncbi:hypothetical protein LJR267_002795 [Paraburkholderia hospita]
MLHNLRVRYVGGRIWTHWWTRQREQLPPGLRAEIERECERLTLLHQQIRRLEVQQDQQVRSGAHPGMALLARLVGIGTGSVWTLVRELFGWRQFRNRRELIQSPAVQLTKRNSISWERIFMRGSSQTVAVPYPG